MAEGADPRLTPARPDLAAERLRGAVEAERYAAPAPARVVADAAPLTARPDAAAPMTTELLRGEAFDVYERAGGWVWGQSRADGYVGYAPAEALADATAAPAPTHRVTALLAHVYPAPDIKSRPVAAPPLGARLAAAPGAPGFLALREGGYLCAAHAAPLDAGYASDWVAVAERFLGAPYLWGGRTARGLDCSGLVQMARMEGGFACLRDSDMQESAQADPVTALARGDLVFWRGHVGVMLSSRTLLHANAHHMAVVAEPLAEAEARIAAAGGGPVTARRRWPAASFAAPFDKTPPDATVS